MGHKSVCVDCRKAFSNFLEVNDHKKEVCPESGATMYFVNQMFKPPKRTDEKKWEVVKYILGSGFDYSHLYEMIDNGVYKQLGQYPETMKEAKELVQRFQANGIKK